MIFPKDRGLYSTEIERKSGENILYINYMGANFSPSIADNPNVMAHTIESLGENPNISRVIFVQQRNSNYDFKEVQMLSEIARVYNYFIKHEEILSPEKLSLFGSLYEVQSDILYAFNLLKQDPIACYYEIKRRIISLRENIEKGYVSNIVAITNYIRFLERVKSMLETTELISKSVSLLDNYNFLSREIYKEFFRPDMLPNFTFTRLAAELPTDSELVDQYTINKDFEKIIVTILKRKNDSKYFYHVMPLEYSLSEEQYILVNLARNILSEHSPKSEEYKDPERSRQIFFNIARDLLSDLAKSKGIVLNNKDIISLAKVLVRHTIGFGLVEVLLMDEKLQDISINAPISLNPIFLRHQKFEECVTNIIPSYEDAESWAAKLRLQSGRPLDEANPILDTELTIGNIRARIAAIGEPLSPGGLSFSIRRQRDMPWTLPLYISVGMLNSFAAGLLSFLVDGNRTLLVAGTRSAGKTSLLGSLMLEIMPKYRTIVIEDTLELPVVTLRNLNYDILRMKVRSALVSGTTEVEASEGIRASLRLGDSALIVGEVRSTEAKALYEAMRVGALANVVAGTIHGDSAYGVFDRVVNDLGVPATSFKATDIIIITNPIKSADGLHSKKRVVSVTEVRKHWETDPYREGGFVELLRYNVESDELEPTEALINGDSEIIKSIASNVKGWAGNWDAVFDNIILRGKIKEEIVNASKLNNKPSIMESEFCVLANEVFHRISEEVRQEKGLPLSEFVLPKFKDWLNSVVSKF
jgi:flagellar protein FlaI